MQQQHVNAATEQPAVESTEQPGIHLCVLVHGLWGNPSHLANISAALREAYPEEFLHILLPKNSAGNLTYDGIELVGERVMREIEDEIERLEKDGKLVKKLSMVGYSLGGLVARYTVGLLHSKGIFNRIKPINFTTFATPHLGVRTPLLGWHNDLFNNLGSRTLSVSGQQLFLIDTFRTSGTPLLSILAHPSSIFIRGLSTFKHKSLYSNIVNDRSVPFYTSYISKTDPFYNLDTIDIHYLKSTEDIIIDSSKGQRGVTPKTTALTTQEWLTNTTSNIISKAPFYMFLGVVLIPVGFTAYLINSGIQSYRSAQRIRMHEEGLAGIKVGDYRLPLMVENAQRRAEQVIETLGASEGEEFLPEQQQEEGEDGASASPDSASEMEKEKDPDDNAPEQSTTEMSGSDFPTLALTLEQFEMIDALDAVGFQKYAVHIHKAPHSHAAIIRRINRVAFSEGIIIAKHWTDHFEL